MQRNPPGGATPLQRRDVLVCFSHLRWNFVFQRPQHLMVRAARRFDVLFFEEPLYGVAGAAPRLETTRVADGITVATPRLPAGLAPGAQQRALHALLNTLLGGQGRARRVFWYYTPMSLAFSDDLPRDATVYDNMDELSAFRGAPPDLLQREQALFARCDLVFCGGRSLFEAKRHRHPHVHAFPSSIDRAHFGRARQKPPAPRDLARVPHPRLAFFGVIDERMDLDLVDRLAVASPEWHWVMLGPVVKIDAASLPRHANLHWLGAVSYHALPSYLAHVDVGFMPFALNESTRFISPTKTPEFLAAGVPVVSTPIHDVVRPYGELGLVEIAADWEQFLSAARQLMRRPREGWLEDVDRFLGDMSWDHTWSGMEGLIVDVLDSADPLPRNPTLTAAHGELPRATADLVPGDRHL